MWSKFTGSTELSARQRVNVYRYLEVSRIRSLSTGATPKLLALDSVHVTERTRIRQILHYGHAHVPVHADGG